MNQPRARSRTRVKICGITDEADAVAAAEAGADAVGFVFHPKSRRFIEPEDAFEIIALLPPMVSSVGLFVDCDIDRFSDIEEACPTTIAQLHGSEPDDVVEACGPGVIKAIRFDPATIAKQLEKYQKFDEVDAILIDGSTGGEGTSFDWNQFVEIRRAMVIDITKPIILAGGLTPENVGAAIRAVQPYAVDVSSGVEVSPGEKCPDKMQAFCRAVRRADAEA
jgi:phosphoribosylanthranilate isomerase